MMADEKPVTGTPSGETPPVPAEPVVQQSTETVEELRAQLARLEAAQKDVNRESAARRKELEQLKSEKAAREESEKTEAQKLADQVTKANAERDAAFARAQDLTLRNAVTIQASKLQFTDPGDALAFIDKSAITVKDDGSVDGLEDALKALAAAKPYLLTTATRGLAGVQPGHGNQPAGETIEQKRARLRTGGETASLSGGYIPFKD
jgi:alanyl-tRNA synthetase